ncbi:hypothetical protein VD0002_g17 [Verticillium dahliae]|uniref:Casein kinase substrate phosphoprotein PP28 domain-containing protein n=2 Tax=Verticillium dahliae TaxID=27337 RepID=G2XH45_VERDV|nr:uncharacterized protein VDAG_09477 [Verticillium dahliae VdLs.17]KAF3344623.1 hypothetical protein VdG2_07311 [Verticillium dahliae VDG2]KAH6688703.1 casein kinase substrate phosphoprotein PP28-domain-containing protein [Verticillium dahliae]EGY19143.1 hypothetical protein VDAG_09477 [Verticillium dahliae VdLs.17]PNH28427.1 hypothetical protein BJF96_g8319 [Verticillium dahliae]PNH39711.1 hypothetical protein VD0004_g7188 [Verticillium dahliae]
MAGGAPGGNSRGRGGKFKKYTRGGGKHFSRDLRPVDSEGNEISMWAAGAKEKGSANASSDEEEEEEDDEEDDDEDDSAAEDKGPVSREERKKLAKARKDAAIAKKKAQAVEVGDMPPSDSEEDESDDDDDDMPANPNHSKAARNQTKAATAKSGDAGVDDVTDGVKGLSAGGAANRKERESAEALVAKEKYRRLHEAGKTDEAKADMARLKLIREQRAAEGARRAAEKEEREAQEAARKAEIDAKEAKKREAALGKKTSKKAK